MNRKQEAAEKLRQYDAMQRARENLPREIQRLRVAALRLREKGEDQALLADNLTQRQELQWTLEETKCWLDVTERALKGLSRQEKHILHRLFISPEKGSIQLLCQELGVEQSSVYRRREKALEHFATALYGLQQ